MNRRGKPIPKRGEASGNATSQFTTRGAIGKTGERPAGPEDAPPATPPWLSPFDSEVWEWVLQARALEDWAFETKSTSLLRFVHKFMTGVLQIKELLDAFRETPAGRVGSDVHDSVVNRLHISRGAIYVRLKWAGLKAEDFRQPKATHAHLIARSTTMGRLLEELKEKFAALPERNRRQAALLGTGRAVD